ncbi:hypothetical protein LXA43DRAFT_977454 [Ganoderma leucocontextum]|nr:hypothetical protein LXA43DRAFT_977454 [Ganoderma leucocontextum]
MLPLQVQNEDAAPLKWNDAHVASRTTDDKWAVTSPNMPFVPTPSIGLIHVVLRSDCRYGAVDPIQWPQAFSEGFELLPIWWSPQEEDFELIHGSVIKCLGLLRRSAVQPLIELVDDLSRRVSSLPGEPDKRLSSLDTAMRHARDRLLCFPCTWRDVRLQVRLTQRFWLMAQAFLDFQAVFPSAGFRRPVDARFMGAFTTDPAAVQELFDAGIPIWWLRLDLSILTDTRVRAIVPLTTPDRICFDIFPGHGDDLYRGLAGAKHLQVPARRRNRSGICRPIDAGARSVDRMGRWASALRSTMPQHTRAHGTQVRGVNKFLPFHHDWMPPDLDIWTAERRERYVYNWLRIRTPWLYILRLREARTTLVPTQWWRDLLYGDTGRTDRSHDTRNGQHMDQMHKVFGIAFQDADYDLASTAPVSWFQSRLSNLDPKHCPMILWELCELGFRHELLTLDRLLREALLGDIFADHSVFCVCALPTQATGLAGPTPFHCVPYPEPFRRVLSRWPCAPSSLYTNGPITTSLSGEEIARREEELVVFYVNTFFEQSGRAPIIPHAVPK